MIATLARYWWTFVLRGVAAIAFGTLAFISPGITLASLILVFGVYALVDGACAIAAAIANWRERPDHWWTLLVGALGILVGLMALLRPGITALGLLLYIVGWTLAVGVLQIVAAIRLRHEIEGEWRLALSGALAVLFALFVMASPGEGVLALLWLIGAFAILFGVLLVAFGFRLRGMARAA